MTCLFIYLLNFESKSPIRPVAPILVGQFNDLIVQSAAKVLSKFTGKVQVWALGKRVHERILDVGIDVVGLFHVPGSIKAITPTIGQILLGYESHTPLNEKTEFHLFYNRTLSVPLYSPMHQRLLPMDRTWKYQLSALEWPTACLPKVVGLPTIHLRGLIREYLFVSLFRVCAESLASEHASRLFSMQRADKNIHELLENLTSTYHHLRQTSIDEELFNVIAGFEAMKQVRIQGD